MSRSLIPRFVALVLVLALGIYYIVFQVLGVSVGSRPMAVTVLMPEAGGLYPGANVTYRGVQVGTVTSLDLSTTDVAVRISIDQGQQIPDNGPVYVKELSALGEQYLDLQPSGSGPDITDGTVIAANRVVLPTPIGTALIDLGTLLQSVDPANVRTVESYLTSAFVGTGPGLRSIIVTGQELFQALLAAQPETVNLIEAGHTDLNTLKATDGDLATFSQGLAALTGTLKSSDSDLRALIANGAAASQALNPFLQQNSNSIEAAIANLATDASLSDKVNPYVQAIFQLLPYVSDDLAASAAGGSVHGLLLINTKSTVCPYLPGASMPGPTEKVPNPLLTDGCTTTAPDMLQRGAGSTPTFTGSG
ncbi:MAG TPA: MlaD family protein [Acidimicrobiales bacterium]|nr:MlaD family protein [Acidimicrobiales bacterium]